VVGAICPWNFPIILSNIKVVSALITGNCVIVKPSPFTPYSVLKSIEICAHVCPPGVIQVLNGGADLGAALTLHPGIAKISFTGTIATGKRVMAACAKTLKRLTLELAGNDACVVCEDVNIDKVAAQVATGSFFNAGQVCVATKRVYVHESIYDQFLKTYVEEVEKGFGVVEDGKTPSLFGPVSNKMQFDIVKGIVDDCKNNGYNVVSGGKDTSAGKGYWIAPTVVSKPPEDSILVKEEQFGKSLITNHMLQTSIITSNNMLTETYQDPSSPSCHGAPKTRSLRAQTSAMPGSARRSTLPTYPAPRRSRASLKPEPSGSICQRRRTQAASFPA
jgi:acyl-CoA reductase-like NAD-dependent aldehyde dehydrogenase